MLNLAIIGFYAVASGFSGNSIPVMPMSTNPNNIQVQQLEAGKDDESKEMSTESYVRNYFSDTPILAEVARCESQFRQTDKNGNVIRGASNRYDVGVMQINELYHSDKAKELGHNLHTIEGNVAYAQYLYDKEGARPWMASSACWAKFKQLAVK